MLAACVGPGEGFGVADDDDDPDDDDATSCLTGDVAACPAASCAALVDERPKLSLPGVWWLDPDGGGSPFRTRCEADPDGGAPWTLAVVSADDATDTFTYDRRGLWGGSVAAVAGSADALDRDFACAALQELPFADVAVRHLPSAVRVEYADVGDGTGSFAALLDAVGEAPCHQSGDGFPPTGGDVPALDGLCDPDLYLNPRDQDGGTGCDPVEPHRSDAWGPAWSAAGNDGCPFDDVGELSSFGPSTLEDPAVEYGAPPAEASRGLGFGQALGLNTGDPGSGDNRIELLLR